VLHGKEAGELLQPRREEVETSKKKGGPENRAPTASATALDLFSETGRFGKTER